MANEFYTKTNAPSTASSLTSSTIRAEFTSIEAGFDILPTMSGNGGELVGINAGATAIEAKNIVAADLASVLDDSMADTLHRHSELSSPDGSSVDQAVLVDNSGDVTLKGEITIENGTNINEFSIDGTLAGNSDDALPTEKAVKTYVDGATPTAHTIASHSDTTATGAELETLTDSSDADSLHTHNLKAPLASPTLTGVPAAPTAVTTTDTTQIATTEFVQQEITAIATAGLGTMPTGVVHRGVIGFDASHGTDATNDIDFAIGVCKDSTNVAVISSTGTITKQLDATWAAENGTTPTGGNLSASAGVASHLYLWVAMGNDVTGDADFGFWDTVDGTSLASRVATAGFSYYKVVGFRHLTSGVAWAGFTQNGDYIVNWTASENVISSGITTTYATVDHTAMVAEGYIELIEYGARDGAATDKISASDDGGTNASFYVGRSGGTVDDTVQDIWGDIANNKGSSKPYSTTREFKSAVSTLDLLFQGCKFKR